MTKPNPFFKNFRSPGVYVEEVSLAPTHIAEVETAIPAFIGYTQCSGENSGIDLTGVPKMISSLQEYSTFFGSAGQEQGISLEINLNTTPTFHALVNKPNACLLYYGIQSFFENGGKNCFIVSIGKTGGNAKLGDYLSGLEESRKEKRISLLSFPDAAGLLGKSANYQLLAKATAQCAELRTRFLLVDVPREDTTCLDMLTDFRNGILQSNGLSFSAAYFPHIISKLNYAFQPSEVAVSLIDESGKKQNLTLAELLRQNPRHFRTAIVEIGKLRPILPPSTFVAGVFADMDARQGVWKAPANVSLQGIKSLTSAISQSEQQHFNVDILNGKSVNVIREFPGRGFLLWGARTLAGNDNEWRFVPVRRLAIMVESSVKEALEKVVFEPNNPNTWTKVRVMTENFLQMLWRKGALQGSTIENAFYVRCGLGHTMNQQDVSEGRLVLEFGISMMRPSEFTVFRLIQNLQSS
ncbi:phage tail sheath family protein [Arthrospiribacter ruber]|uniref:Phage tail sheath family protein n=1 Tax=Arthrospiribacter ruber TaxID=2487934 RepID=A0A951IWM7_9BACT|nr:phage tail sheath subtilisin-like domain-containing protein [Arthrospiribacter ruber]MBW3467447.1 phage tail sheath family protein [Arthrospiribacter ruber]